MSRAKFLSALMTITCLLAQDPRIEFEVASIKPNLGGPESGFSWDTAPSGRVSVRNLEVWNLIRAAYGLRDNEMAGGPAWIKNRRFDIQAQPAQSAMPVPREQTLRMLQNLLEDRFRLKWHRESREAPAYGLTVGAHGHKLPPPREGRGPTKFGDLDAPSMSMDSLCQILESELHRPVLNRTGLSGSFAVRLQWASERAPSTNPPDASLPSLFTALQEQLGLKLESIKAPVDFFVIDSVELPSEN